MKNICSEKSLKIVMFKFSKLGSKNYKIFSVSRTSFHLIYQFLAGCRSPGAGGGKMVEMSQLSEEREMVTKLQAATYWIVT